MSPDIAPTVFLIIKTLVILGFGIYSIFAFIIVRQEHLMATVLEESFEPVLRLMTYIHLALSVGLIAFAFMIL